MIAFIFTCVPSNDSGALTDILDALSGLAAEHLDYDGKRLKMTFAYRVADSDEAELSLLSRSCRDGLGEIECLLNVKDSTGGRLRDDVGRELRRFHEYGWAKTVAGEVRFAVASQPGRDRGEAADCRGRIRILRDLGCYADLSYPDLRSDHAPSEINSVQVVSAAVEDPYATAVTLRAGEVTIGDLLTISGPTLIAWANWSNVSGPLIESGQLSPEALPDPERAETWIRANVHVTGQPNWIFVKLIVGGIADLNSAETMVESLDRVLAYAENVYNDGVTHRLHYVTAREMYNIAMAAEAAKTGNAGVFRDYLIGPYEAVAAEKPDMR
jgi:hypothetical protein